jgi:3-hydroxyacyl-CoA dehydrogenase/enoyl-CoA hydratase/3-hydroxybutyryl-CoA epimerase
MGFDYKKDKDGIVTVTMDMEGQGANTMNAAYRELIKETVEKLEAEKDLKGVVFASAKKTFFAGGDLNALLAVEKADEVYFGYVEENKAFFRRLEKLPVPVVAAINGAALGGGFELCLACNHRVVLDAPHAVTGLPEVTLGLLPGAGGVVRMVAKIGLEAALPLLLEGKQLRPADALKAGLIDAVVEKEADLIKAAKAWIKDNPDAAVQPWDKRGFKYPNGDASAPNVRLAAAMAPTMLVKRTRGLMPAPAKILDIAVNSMRMGFESALRVESRGFCDLVQTPEAKAAISTFFFGLNAIKGGKHRPEGEAWQVKSSAILGAGMMGAGIAWAHASRGIPATLKDMSIEGAEKGKAHTEGLVKKRIQRGRMDEARGKDVLGLITPATEDGAYKGCDIIIEAVFEDIELKEKVIPESFKQLGKGGIFGSNTSTLPISLLAESCPEPERFIGIHFFSPVEKMQLVELIVGEKTSEDTVRKAYDYTLQIGKLPIVVNDSRGFFTSRVFGTYCDEGAALLRDGVSPVAIERAAWSVGMPVGPLAVSDEVSLELQKKVFETHITLDNRLGVNKGYPAEHDASMAVNVKLADQGRGGRKFGAGFYDYKEDGSKTLWDGLEAFTERRIDVETRDIRDRLIYRQVIETLRCYTEGVLRNEIEANIGSVFGIGFPPHTGGALQFVRGTGIDAFETRAGELAKRYGDRFALPPGALDKLRSAKRKVA